jgi:catalase
MEGFGVHRFRLVNAEGKSIFVKFHWKPRLGMQSVVWNEAVKINGVGPEAGPREDPNIGFHSYFAVEEGPKLRIRAESFADHYSQTRQFYISQTPIEQNHIADAFTVELSKVENPAI